MSELAGVLQYDLTANTTKLDQGLDRAESKVKKSGSDMAASLTGPILGGALLAGAGVVAFGAKAFKAYSGAEQASSMLEHAILSVTKGTKEQLAQTNALADALEKKGVLDGDNIKIGLAQLSTFGLSNTAVQNLGGSLADLAVNQFGVSASGDQLSQSANMIAKALNGQFGVLEKSGIRFSEAQKHVIEFGTEMEKVTAINDGFAQNLKYTNEVALNDTAGKLAAAKVQLENFQEAIGQLVSQAITPIITKFNEWVVSMGGAEAMLGKITTYIKDNIENIKLVAIVLGVVVGGIFVLALAAFLKANLLVIALGVAVGSVIYFIKNLRDNWDLLKEAFSPGSGNLMAGVVKIAFAPFFVAYEVIKKILGAVNSLTGGGLNKIGGKIGDFFGGGRAIGGPVKRNTSYLVGEKGPELFTPNSGGNISTAGETAGMLAQGGGGGSIIINVGSVNDSSMIREITNAVEQALSQNQRRTAFGLA